MKAAPFLACLLLVSGAAAISIGESGAAWIEQVGLTSTGGTALTAIYESPAPTVDSVGLRWHFGAPVRNFTFKACEIGSACWDIGVPAEFVRNDTARGEYVYRTSTEHLDTHLQPKLEGGEEVGFQIHLEYLDFNGTWVEVDFPKGLDIDSGECKADYLACERTNYISQIVANPSKPTPVVPFAFLVLGLLGLRRKLA